MSIDLSSSEQIRKDLLNYFQHNELVEEELLSECENICKNFHITPENLYYKWEAVKFNTRGPSIIAFNANSVKEIKAKIQRDALAEQMKQKARTQLSGRMGRGSGPVPGLPNLMGTPVKKPLARGITAQVASGSVAGPSRVKFVGPSTDSAAMKKRAYRYMYEKISERSEVLDDWIDEFAELVREHYSISDFGDPNASTDEDTVVVGRIVPDVESASTKLNDASVMIESSRLMGFGVRVPLRFDSQLKIRGSESSGGVGLFPGAIVALKGKNGGGGYYLVNEILTLPPLKTCPIDSSGDDSPASICLTSGPYTPDTDLGYKPWTNLLKKVKTNKPVALILLGPFIDVNHPHIKTGDTDHTPAQLFQTHFVDGLTDFLSASPGSCVIIVPSTKDILSDHPVYPQGELHADLAYDPRIHFVPNPCRFSLNSITFGVSTVDVLFHLRKEELFKRAAIEDSASASADAMANLCKHLLQQRSFYPLFPVPVELSHDVNLDVSHSDQLRIYSEGSDAYAPDVLIVPSRLKQFSKVADETVAINPGFLTKGIYAEVKLPGRRSANLKDEIVVNLEKLDG